MPAGGLGAPDAEALDDFDKLLTWMSANAPARDPSTPCTRCGRVGTCGLLCSAPPDWDRVGAATAAFAAGTAAVDTLA